MTKWITSVTAAALICLAQGSDARAQQIEVSVDGCALLARAVYEEVSGAATAGPHRSGPWMINPRFEDIEVCDTATRTVSKAFKLAMASEGIDVRWDGGAVEPGDICLSAFLSQCYPNRYPLAGAASDLDAAFVQRSWSIVSTSVMRAMANPYSSDEVRFRPGEMRLQMGLALRTVERRR